MVLPFFRMIKRKSYIFSVIWSHDPPFHDNQKCWKYRQQELSNSLCHSAMPAENNKNRFIQLYCSTMYNVKHQIESITVVAQVKCILVTNPLTHLIPNKLHFAIFTHCIGERTNLFMNLHKRKKKLDINARQWCFW